MGAWCWSCVWNEDWDYPDETVFVELSVSILDKNHTETFRDVYTRTGLGQSPQRVRHPPFITVAIYLTHRFILNSETHTHKTPLKKTKDQASVTISQKKKKEKRIINNYTYNKTK